jgi:hypothetical protein
MVEEHPLHHPKAEGSHPTRGTDTEKLKKLDLVRDVIDCRIMVEEHPPHYPKVEGSNTSHGIDREKHQKSNFFKKLAAVAGGRTPTSSSKG